MSLANKGMKTKEWGPYAWKTYHFFAMGYPVKNPTLKKQREYSKFYKYFGDTLPCGLCRDSYKKFIKELPFTDKVLESRKNLFYHTLKIHNLVNKKLNCKVLKKDEFFKMYKQYDSSRSKGCSKKALGCL